MSDATVEEKPRDTAKIALLNDRLRSGFTLIADPRSQEFMLLLNANKIKNGTVHVTPGVVELLRKQGPRLFVQATRTLNKAIADFSAFTNDNDPYGEHDFGSFPFDGQTVYWKVDYYDNNKEFASPDPADPNVTFRVLTILLASEY